MKRKKTSNKSLRRRAKSPKGFCKNQARQWCSNINEYQEYGSKKACVKEEYLKCIKYKYY